MARGPLRSPVPYDLLGSSDCYRLEFDLFTPRAHFVILAKQPPGKLTFEEFNGGQRQELVEFASEISKKFKISGILSIHRGQWFNPKPEKFHGHFCVDDVEEYVKIYERLKTRIPNYPHSLEVVYANKKNWLRGTRAEDYPANVRAYPPLATTAKYFNADRKDIEDDRATTSSPGPRELDGYRLHYGLRYLPRIYFQPLVNDRNTSQVMKSLKCLNALDHFSRRFVCQDGAGNWHRGCHICVFLKQENIDGTLSDGYVQLDGKMFYDLCPADKKESWYQVFKKKGPQELKVMT
ncbi:uncharacterized protein LOC106150686 [Lingula anatina]|uniref:Uncharacterized protein LOC106150686 n=1 Tax=Lingula anatina TaxID=7574 RepID=A0A1S3H0S8_LINAN|nr:uncharacterized protein LOC106150686 [Lingula anatina]|eukprot:XP_013379076.1 uncharacterized protein LOC106150686 [Lingula anatina]